MGLYVLRSYQEVNGLTKASLILLMCSVYVGWYSFCTNSWGRTTLESNDNYYVGYGVWKVADNAHEKIGGVGFNPIVLATTGWLLQWYTAFQTFATLGFISVNVGYFLMVLLVYVAPCKNNADLAFWAAVNSLFGGVSWIVAVVVFAVHYDNTYSTVNIGGGAFGDGHVLHYSFYLGALVAVLQIIAGVLLLVSGRSSGGSETQVTSQ